MPCALRRHPTCQEAAALGRRPTSSANVPAACTLLDHPRTVYLREADLLPRPDGWLTACSTRQLGGAVQGRARLLVGQTAVPAGRLARGWCGRPGRGALGQEGVAVEDLPVVVAEERPLVGVELAGVGADR